MRIVGINVARALAVFGMILVNFKVVIGHEGAVWLKNFAGLLDGKAAATFVVLAGIGLALMTKGADRQADVLKWKNVSRRILKRAAFLFILGLSYYWIWPADILHYYGVYMLISFAAIPLKNWQILAFSIAAILAFPLLLLFVDYEAAWNFKTLHYADFWTVKGFLRNLFFNGFHPVLPWVAFMLYGLWLGRQKLMDRQFLRRAFITSLTAFLTIQLASIALLRLAPNSSNVQNEIITLLFNTGPMPPLPMFMLNGITFSTAIITACIWLGERYENHMLITILNQTGKLALSFYVAHIIIGMGLIEMLGSKPLGHYSLTFSLLYGVVFSLCCSIFAVFWLQNKTTGPLEWVMRKFTD